MPNDMQNWIQEIVDLGIRRPGSPENHATEQYLVNKFEEFGLVDIKKEPIPLNYWAHRSTELSIANTGKKIGSFSVPYTAWTSDEGLTAEAVYIGHGSQAELDAVDLKGKIAVLDVQFSVLSGAMLRSGTHFEYDPGKTIPDGPLHVANWLIVNFNTIYEVQRRGGVAMLGILNDSPIDGPDFYAPYDGFLKELPAAWVGREHGELLTQLAQQKEKLHFKSLGTTSEVNSHNILATVPGQGDETIILTCHHDAPYASAVEDASGLAELLWLARHFAERKEKLKRNLVFVASSGHFHGGIGNRVFVEQHRDGLPQKKPSLPSVIEHVAEESDSRRHGRLPAHRPTRTSVSDHRQKTLPYSICSNQPSKNGSSSASWPSMPICSAPNLPAIVPPFFTAGIPSVCHISGPLYLFDPYDTLDKVRSEDLDRVAGLFREYIEQIDNINVAVLEKGQTRHRDDPPPELSLLVPTAAKNKLVASQLSQQLNKLSHPSRIRRPCRGSHQFAINANTIEPCTWFVPSRARSF